MLYSITKKSGSRRELNKIKKIKAKDSKKLIYSSSDSLSSYLDSPLYSDSEWDEPIQPTEHKEINKLYHLVTDNIKKNKNQRNDAIKNEQKFDNKFSFSRGT